MTLAETPEIAFVDKNGNYPQKKKAPKGQSVKSFLEANIGKNEIWAVNYFDSCLQGHIISAERMADNNLRLYDPQNNKILFGEKINNYFKKISDIDVFPLSGYQLNDSMANEVLEEQKWIKK